MNRLFDDNFQSLLGQDDNDSSFNPSLDIDQHEDRYEVTMEKRHRAVPRATTARASARTQPNGQEDEGRAQH
jgi:hypothetical protein